MRVARQAEARHTEAQKEALLLRAIQAEPSFYEKVLEQALTPLTEEAAETRVGSLDGEAIATAVRWYASNGASANALSRRASAAPRLTSDRMSLDEDAAGRLRRRSRRAACTSRPYLRRTAW